MSGYQSPYCLARVGRECFLKIENLPPLLEREFAMRVFRAVLCVVLMVLCCMPLNVFAQKTGPCNVWRPGGIAPPGPGLSPIGCYSNPLQTLLYCFCGGGIDIIPEASTCGSVDSIPCAEVPVEDSITFLTDGSNCLTYRIVFPAVIVPTCGGTCFQDPTTRTPVWGTAASCK